MTTTRMKTAALFLSIATLHTAAFALLPLDEAYAKETASLTITFQGMTRQAGDIRAQIFDSEAAYRGRGQPVAAFAVPVAGDNVSTTVTGLKPGRYAVRAFHDVDGDGRFSTNAFGIPTEPFAFSNDATGAFGPASWSDAAFEIGAGDATTVITID